MSGPAHNAFDGSKSAAQLDGRGWPVGVEEPDEQTGRSLVQETAT